MFPFKTLSICVRILLLHPRVQVTLQQSLFQRAVFKEWIWSVGRSLKFIKHPCGGIALSDVDIQVKQQDIQKKMELANWKM